MELAAIHCTWLVTPGSREVSFRLVGLSLTAVAFILAFLSPVMARGRRRAAPAQLATAVYAFMAAAGIATIAAVVAIWFKGGAGDDLSVDGAVLLLSLVLLLAALLGRQAIRGMGTRHLSQGFAVVWFSFVGFVPTAIMLGYVWLGPMPDRATMCQTGSIHNGVLLVAGFTALVAIGAMLQPLSVFLQTRHAHELFSGMVWSAAGGVAFEVVLVVMRGPGGWYTGSHTAGLDLIAANVALGLAVFLYNYVRTAPVSNRPPPTPYLLRVAPATNQALPDLAAPRQSAPLPAYERPAA